LITCKILLGGIPDGPSDASNFQDLGVPDGAKSCSTDFYAAFDTTSTEYQDNVASWPSVEPADDYTVISLLTFSRMAATNSSDGSCCQGAGDAMEKTYSSATSLQGVISMISALCTVLLLQ
jgi:hypothetical protein